MCQIDSQYMLSSNFSSFCVLVAVVRVFTGSTPEEAPVLIDLSALVAFCGCANVFCRLVPALKFNFHDVIAEIGNVPGYCLNRTSGRMAIRD